MKKFILLCFFSHVFAASHASENNEERYISFHVNHQPILDSMTYLEDTAKKLQQQIHQFKDNAPQDLIILGNITRDTEEFEKDVAALDQKIALHEQALAYLRSATEDGLLDEAEYLEDPEDDEGILFDEILSSHPKSIHILIKDSHT